MFFYAGHGIAVDGTNYLLPVDVDIKSEMDVKLGNAINIDVTLDQTMGDAKVKLVFLDACRDNPFATKIRSAARSRSVTVHTGLAEMRSGEGTLIAFATGPGQTASDGQQGSNSPFTRGLLANIAQPGIEIQQAMTRVRAQVNEETGKGQLPWGHTNLIGSVYLNPVAAPDESPVAADAPASMTRAASETELEFWRSIRDTNKPEELNAYLTNYPNGQFRALALARLAKLEKGVETSRTPGVGIDPAIFAEEPTQVTEDQIGLNRTQRREVQRRLNGLGFDTEVTGKFDDQTRAVLSRWQAARGYPISGFLNKLQHKALMAEIAASETSSGEEKPASRARQGSTAGARKPSGVLEGPGNLIGGMVGGILGRR